MKKLVFLMILLGWCLIFGLGQAFWDLGLQMGASLAGLITAFLPLFFGVGLVKALIRQLKGWTDDKMVEKNCSR